MQNYDPPGTPARPNAAQLRQGLGYVPSRAPMAAPGSGLTVIGGPSAPVIGFDASFLRNPPVFDGGGARDGEDGQLGPPGVRGPQGPSGLLGPPGTDGLDGHDGMFIPSSNLPGATSTLAVAAPAAANSTAAFTMQGLGGSITPRRSGNILVSIAGTVTAAGAATVDNGVILQGSYGTGAAPTSNAALIGTQAGALQAYTWPVAPTALADVNYGFNVTFLIPFAILGVALWLDLAAKAVTTVSDAPLVNVVVTAVEL